MPTLNMEIEIADFATLSEGGTVSLINSEGDEVFLTAEGGDLNKISWCYPEDEDVWMTDEEIEDAEDDRQAAKLVAEEAAYG